MAETFKPEEKKIPKYEFLTPATELIPGLNVDGLALTAKERSEVWSKNQEMLVGGLYHATSPEEYAYGLRNFLIDLSKIDPEKFAKVKARFAGRPLVDLGAGNNEAGYTIAQIFETSGYIAVDPYNGGSLPSEIQHEILYRARE